MDMLDVKVAVFLGFDKRTGYINIHGNFLFNYAIKVDYSSSIEIILLISLRHSVDLLVTS